MTRIESNERTPKLLAIVFVLAIVGLHFTMAGCAKKQFDKVGNGFRTIGIGMSREQVMERIESDERFLALALGGAGFGVGPR